MIVYTLLARESVGKLFATGLMPAGIYMLYIFIFALNKPGKAASIARWLSNLLFNWHSLLATKPLSERLVSFRLQVMGCESVPVGGIHRLDPSEAFVFIEEDAEVYPMHHGEVLNNGILFAVFGIHINIGDG